jgi:phosphatidylinositol-3-phosphatase
MNRTNAVIRLAAPLLLCGATSLVVAQTPSVRTVFVVAMSDQPWSAIKGNSSAPFINGTLLPAGSSANAYYAPSGNATALPNYLWLEAGGNFGVSLDETVQQAHQATTNHLTSLLSNAGVSWKAYYEDIDGTRCPLLSAGPYSVYFNPFVYFDDVTSNMSSSSATCLTHVRPYNELATDLTNNTVAQYVFIRPSVCHAMYHSCTTASDRVKTGDQWLAQEVPKILASSAYLNGGALFIVWDRASVEVPIGLIALSPLAKQGYTNAVRYTHGSTLRTIEEIFAVSPLLGSAANETALDDFFGLSTVSHGGVKLSWSPSPGAATYNVKRATAIGGSYTTIATGLTTPHYTDSALTGGQTYFYVVSAVNAIGESPASAPTTAVVPSVPPAPANLTVTVGQ